MGLAKRLLEEQEDMAGVAAELLLRAGAARRCVHETLEEDDPGALEGAYRLGNSLISANDELVRIFRGQRRRMTDTVKRVFDALPYKCALCERLEHD